MPDLERIQQLTPGTLSQQWYEDGVAVDPGTVTVGITRADGTILVAAGTSTSGTGTAARTFNLTTTHTALLDTLKVTWTSTLKGTLVSYVEVAGGFLYTIAEAKAIPALVTVSASAIAAKRIQAEQTLERAFSIAFVPRYERETLSGDGTGTLLLKWPKIRAIRSATVSGIALTSGDLANLTFDQNGILTGYTWTRGTGNVVLGYEHGWDYPPEPIRDAALAIANYSLTSGKVGSEGIDGRIEYITTPEGRINYGSGPLGLPAVQRAASLYDMSVGVA